MMSIMSNFWSGVQKWSAAGPCSLNGTIYRIFVARRLEGEEIGLIASASSLGGRITDGVGRVALRSKGGHHMEKCIEVHIEKWAE